MVNHPLIKSGDVSTGITAAALEAIVMLLGALQGVSHWLGSDLISIQVYDRCRPDP